MKYHLLEEKIIRSVAYICAAFCNECVECCCREDICRESINSYWLKLLWQIHGQDVSKYDRSKGWSTSHGCQLPAGRPPVCYEYFCNKILDALKIEPFKEYLKKISLLISLAGKNALGNKHIVTLSDEQILHRVDFKRIINKISTCLELYDQYDLKL